MINHKEWIRKRSRVDENGCWIWQGFKDRDGYGRACLNPHKTTAHRISAHLFLGFDLRSKLFVCHHCDVPACVNPKHLFIGTPAQNQQDAFKKRGGRHTRAVLYPDQVSEILSLYDDGVSPKELAGLFDVTRSCIYMIVRKVNWAHVA